MVVVMWRGFRWCGTVQRCKALALVSLGQLVAIPSILAQVPPLAPVPPCPPGTALNVSQPALKPSDPLATLPVKLVQGFEAQSSSLLALINQLGREPAAWPGLAERARLARVPVLMYHDVTDQPEVFFDLTPQKFEARLEEIRTAGATPISMMQLILNLRFGVPLPPKPVLLTFDDGYAGHYKFVFPLLQRYRYPAVFSIYTRAIDQETAAQATGAVLPGRPHMTWEQLREMKASGLVTIASHSVSHPPDLTQLDDAQLRTELVESRQRLEQELGQTVPFFTYPAGHYDERVEQQTAAAGYQAALTMTNVEADETFAGNSKSLLAIQRFGQSRISELLPQAWQGPPFSLPHEGLSFKAPVAVNRVSSQGLALTLISGGRPRTFHANSRYQVTEILTQSGATAAVDGGFFSLEHLDSNEMIGPVLSQNTGQFIPDLINERVKLRGRPLVLIGSRSVRYVPFDPDKHNTLAGIQVELPDVTDAFLASAWLVKDGVPRPYESFGNLYGFDANRQRAFWGLNEQGLPVIGVSHDRVDSVELGRALAAAGLREAVMLDSGASTSLAYRNESLVDYLPRPVPHAVTLSDETQPVVASCPSVAPLSQAEIKPQPRKES